MSTARERIQWLAELSAERRAMRAAGLEERYIIWFQTGKLPYTERIWQVGRTERYRVECDDKGEPVKTKSDTLPFNLFEVIIGLQDRRCYLCGEPFPECRHEAGQPTREHVLPRGRGGRDDDNILAACRPCNNKKADRWPYPCELIYLEGLNLRKHKLGSRGCRRKRKQADD